MSLEEGIKELEKDIDRYTKKLRESFKDGSTVRRRANLRAKLDNLCEERDFYKRKLKEKDNRG